MNIDSKQRYCHRFARLHHHPITTSTVTRVLICTCHRSSSHHDTDKSTHLGYSHCLVSYLHFQSLYVSPASPRRLSSTCVSSVPSSSTCVSAKITCHLSAIQARCMFHRSTSSTFMISTATCKTVIPVTILLFSQFTCLVICCNKLSPYFHYPSVSITGMTKLKKSRSW